MLRLFRALDRQPQWLAALTLVALVATLASGHVVRGIAAPLAEKTGFKLVDLEFSGWNETLTRFPPGAHPLNNLLGGIGFETHSAKDIIEAWRKADVLATARRAQKADFVFAAAYGAFALLLAVALWRGQPEYPRRVRWVRLVALGAVAAVLDEIENVRLWTALQGSGDPSAIGFVLPTTAAALKFALLIAALVGVVVSLLRAHNAVPTSGDTPRDADERRTVPLS
jgi:hypothetical protein